MGRVIATLFGVILLSPGALAQPELSVSRVTPSGDDVPAGRQIVIEFNRPMVPLGRMQRSAAQVPAAISPQLNCHWRWLNRQTLACNLDQQDQLVAATRYTVTVPSGTRADDGATLARTVQRHFVTQRPMVEQVTFNSWKHPGVPLLRVVFNQPVSGLSVGQQLSFKPASSGSPVDVVVSAEPDEHLPRYLRMPDGQWVLGSDSDTTGEQVSAASIGEQARRIWLLEPSRALPLNRHIELAQHAGLVSALGTERGIARSNIITFHTYPGFRFIGVRCQSLTGKRVLLSVASAVQPDVSRCDPLAGIAVAFSAPVLLSELRRTLLFDPETGVAGEGLPLWSGRQDFSRLRQPHRPGATYDYWLPGRLRANQSYRLSLRPVASAKVSAALHDEFQRPLQQAIDFTFHTSHRRPQFDLVHHDAVLETAVDSEPPLYVTNLNKIHLGYRRLDQQGLQTALVKSIAPPPVPDLAFAIPLPVREMLQAGSGAVYGAISSEPQVERKGDRERRFFAQVTPYQVHAKVGHFNTLIWVTDLRSGQVVPGARVAIYRAALSQLGPVPEAAEHAVTDQHGMATLPGTAQLDPELKTLGWRCFGDDCQRLLVRVDGELGMALLPLNRSYRADSYRVSNYQVLLDQRQQYGHITSWGLTAQGVYRAGDNIQYKLFVRDHNNRRFSVAPRGHYTLELLDPTGKVVHRREGLALDAFGALHGAYPLPQTSVMGWYQFRLKADFSDYQWQPMRVLVSDFTPAPFRVSNTLNGDRFSPGDTLLTTTRAALHSGGAYTQAQARVTVKLRSAPFRASAPEAREFTFDTATETHSLQLHQNMASLNAQGTVEDALVLPPSDILFGRLSVESAVRDDRGQFIAASSSADYLAIDRLVGLRKKRWVFDVGTSAAIDYLVVDERGQLIADTPVNIRIERLDRRAARVKGAGNAYITRFSEHWQRVGSCQGRPQGAALSCEFTPETVGRYRFIAEVTDTQGRRQQTLLSAWAVGSGNALWREDAGYALAIEADKERYQIGDTARFLIKNPFPGATALVTLERFGVLKQWQQQLQGSTPVLELKLDKDYAPGVYLSVVVVSPRVADPPAADSNGAEAGAAVSTLDLGKPAFRMGYVAVPVADPDKALAVTVSTDRDTYKPGATVRVQLSAGLPKRAADTRDNDTPLPLKAAPIEYAVVVLDEAVLDLIAGGRDYFDPYKGFYQLRGLDVDNYNLLTRIVGRHRFEKKGANAGGDGGHSLSLRSLFAFVGYWNPSLGADDNGKASFEFTLPDNLTGWRVLALAVTPGDRFGLGDVTFTTNQPTQLRPVMPNQVSEGDVFNAGFAVLNRTARARTLQVVVDVEGDVQALPALRTTVQLDAYQRETVYVSLSAEQLALDRERSEGEIILRARAWDQDDGDALSHSLPVHKRRELKVAAIHGSLAAMADHAQAILPVQVPDAIYSDTGQLATQLGPSVIGNLEGVFRYMRDYDHHCWEQLLSRAVMAAHYQHLQTRLPADFTWAGSAQLPANLLSKAADYQAPNGGMSYFIPQQRYVSPYLSAYTALAFSWLRVGGYAPPASVEVPLQQYLLRLLRRDDLPDFYSRSMAATVRAVALNALSASALVTPADIRRHTLHLEQMDLFGAANLLAAAQRTEGADDLVVKVREHVLSHVDQSSGKLTFTEQLDDHYARLLSSPLRTQCAILSALVVDEPSADSGLDEQAATMMVRALTQARGRRDHWQNTQENMFCINALLDYARSREAQPPDMSVSVAVNDHLLGRTAFRAYNDPAVTLRRPLVASDAGDRMALSIAASGRGRLYYTARLAYAEHSPAVARINAGIDIRREYAVQRNGKWLMLSDGDEVERGELLRIDLFMALPASRNFVVVADPVPGGLEPVNRDLATASGVDTDGTYQAAAGSHWLSRDDWLTYGASRWRFYHRELRHDAVRFYADYLPSGSYHLSYTAQAIASGRFAGAPAVAAQMYDSDVYGKSLPITLRVR